jgi:hypothetical protein
MGGTQNVYGNPRPFIVRSRIEAEPSFPAKAGNSAAAMNQVRPRRRLFLERCPVHHPPLAQLAEARARDDPPERRM